MPEIISVQKEAVTGFNLGQLSFWRLQIDTTLKGPKQVPCFSLVMRYPPGDVGSMVALARCTVTIADSYEELHRVTSVATAGGTLDADILRMAEGFNLFKNHERLKGDALEQCIADSKRVLQAYWKARLWVEGGCREEETVEVDLENDPVKLLLRP